MIIGLDIGGTNIKGVIVDSTSVIRAQTKVPTGKAISETTKNILQCIDILRELSHINKNEVEAIGIGSAGAIDKHKGIVITSPNIPWWKNYPVVQQIQKLSGYNTFLENDANCAVFGELWLGNGKHFKNWIMLTLGTGIGGGAVINGVPYTGRAGSAMEFGHTTIDYNGLLCKCGRKGCLECYGSATAVVNFTKSHISMYPDSSIIKRTNQETLTAQIVFEEAQKGDALALYIFNLIGQYLGIGIANFVNIFNPEAVILGGGLSNAHKFFMTQIIQGVQTLALAGMKEDIHYCVTSYGDYTAAIGAAKYALDNLK
jgi:glucokinase